MNKLFFQLRAGAQAESARAFEGCTMVIRHSELL